MIALWALSLALADEQERFREWTEATARSTGANVSSFVRPARFPGDESQHQLGLAADFTSVDQGALDRVAESALAAGYRPVSEKDHLHVQRFAAGFLRRCGLI